MRRTATLRLGVAPMPAANREDAEAPQVGRRNYVLSSVYVVPRSVA